MNKFYVLIAMFLMGFLFLRTPELNFLHISGFDIGLFLKSVLDLAGLAMMVYSAFEMVRTWRRTR